MLTLPIKKKWFDMVLSGEKKEEYRDIKPYYTSRFTKALGLNPFERLKSYLIDNEAVDCTMKVMFRNGYSHNSPYFIAECKLVIGKGKVEWGAVPNRNYYVLKIIAIEK